MKEGTIIVTFIVLCAIIGAIAFFIYKVDTPEKTASSSEQKETILGTKNEENEQKTEEKKENTLQIQKDDKASQKPPEMIIDPEQPYRAILKTSLGDIGIRLYSEKTPKTVNNFIYLAKKDFYDNTIFHRVIRDFMIQGGDPNGDGTGGPGYTFDDEPFEGEYNKGIVAMANRGPNTNGSQFFIMHGDVDLPKSYVIFGEIDWGIVTVDEIALGEVEKSPSGEMSQPVEPVVIEDLEILEE